MSECDLHVLQVCFFFVLDLIGFALGLALRLNFDELVGLLHCYKVHGKRASLGRVSLRRVTLQSIRTV